VARAEDQFEARIVLAKEAFEVLLKARFHSMHRFEKRHRREKLAAGSLLITAETKHGIENQQEEPGAAGKPENSGVKQNVSEGEQRRIVAECSSPPKPGNSLASYRRDKSWFLCNFRTRYKLSPMRILRNRVATLFAGAGFCTVAALGIAVAASLYQPPLEHGRDYQRRQSSLRTAMDSNRRGYSIQR
jgi:hypothetical protein